MTKVKFKSDVFKCSSKFIFYKFYVLSYKSKCLNNYQLNFKKIKKDYQKKVCERYENLSKEEKKKSDNMVTKIFQKMENKSLLSIEKKI